MTINRTIITTIFLLLTYNVTAITYSVVNPDPKSSGGARFEAEVGTDYALRTLSAATNFIWQTFHQVSDVPYHRKPNITRVMLFITAWEGEVQTTGNRITISSVYIKTYKGDLKREITRLIYHELTHVLQWTDDGKAPRALVEGIADYVKIKAGYPEEQFKKKPGDGQSWDQGFEITAYFLDYCASLRSGFVAELNARMKTAFKLTCFKEMLGKPVYRLWDDYKDKYSHKIEARKDDVSCVHVQVSD